jgi:hypothetical protein
VPAQPDLDGVPEEFRPACGHPGARVIVRHFPVTIPHALCDLTGVALSYPSHGGATVPAEAGGIYNSWGFRLSVHSDTLDVTVDVRLHRDRSNDPPGTKYH